MGSECEFDRAVDALGHRYRRRLLVALRDNNPDADDTSRDVGWAVETIEKAENSETNVETQLIHNHLPRLDEKGYITRNRAAGTLERGPQWDEIEPLLGLLCEHAENLPDGWQ